MKAYLVRHGDSVGNELGLFRSCLDSPLTNKGIQQANDAAEWLKDKPIKNIICSPLLRSFITADAIAKPHNLFVYQHRGCLPWNLGVFTGLLKDENQDALKLFVDNPDIVIPSGAATGESFNDFMDRQQSFWKMALKISELTVFVCHNSVITALKEMTSDDETDIAKNEIISPGGIIELTGTPGNYVMKPVFGEIREKAVGLGS